MNWLFPFLILGVILTIYLTEGTNVPREILDNNPGGIRDMTGNAGWVGQQGTDGKNFVQFDTPTNGIRALCLNLLHKQEIDGKQTLNTIFAGYSTDQPDPWYANNILGFLLNNGYAPITIDSPISVRNNMDLFCRAVIHNELTINPYPDSIIQAGEQAALIA
jgi:hypothetical protein